MLLKLVLDAVASKGITTSYLTGGVEEKHAKARAEGTVRAFLTTIGVTQLSVSYTCSNARFTLKMSSTA